MLFFARFWLGRCNTEERTEQKPETDIEGCSPVHVAARFGQTRVLEVLCAAGCDLVASDACHLVPLDVALRTSSQPGGMECARVLVANGVRLSTVRKKSRRLISPELIALERGVQRCRAAVVAVLHVKRSGGRTLAHWDRFLLALLAVDVWATRYAKEWQAARRGRR